MTNTTNNIIETKNRAEIGRNAGLVGIVVNLILFVIKFVSGILTGSVSFIADAVNNLTDAGSSILVIVGYVISIKPADREHPFGHARMEYLCHLFISIIVTVLGIELFKSSLESLFGEAEVASYSTASIIVMLIAIAAKIVLALFYKSTAKKIDSETLAASAADSIGDVCATSAVILGIILTPVIGKLADGIIGAVIAAYILIMGVKMIISASDTLLGKAPDMELVKKIVGKLKSYDGVMGIHDLVVHSYGVDTYFATVHIEMDAGCDIMVSHSIIDNIEVDFKEQMGIRLVIHLDPITVGDERVDALHQQIRGIIDDIAAEYSTPISIHDFRVVFGNPSSTLLFDVAITDNFPFTNDELAEQIKNDIVKKIGGEFKTVLTIDRDYTATRY